MGGVVVVDSKEVVGVVPPRVSRGYVEHGVKRLIPVTRTEEGELATHLVPEYKYSQLEPRLSQVELVRYETLVEDLDLKSVLVGEYLQEVHSQ